MTDWFIKGLVKDLRRNFLPGKIKMKKSYVKLDSNKKPLITLYGFEFPIKLKSILESQPLELN